MTVDDSFYSSVLSLIGAPTSANNISILKRWQTFEGGNASWNPLNTTKSAPGATSFNSAGVKNYPDKQTGITATALTLMNGYYSSILDALKKDAPLSWWQNTSTIWSNLQTWGTVNFASWLKKQIPSTVIPVVPNVPDEMSYDTKKKFSSLLSY